MTTKIGSTSVTSQFIINPNLKSDVLNGKDMERALNKIVKMATQYAINIAPTRDGDLVASIRGFIQGSSSGKEGVIEVGTDHWMYVEYGTGIRGAASHQPAPGTAAGWVHGPSAGQTAQPFMRLTLWWIRNQVGP